MTTRHDFQYTRDVSSLYDVNPGLSDFDQTRLLFARVLDAIDQLGELIPEGAEQVKVRVDTGMSRGHATVYVSGEVP